MGGLWHGAISTKNVGTLHSQKSMGQSQSCRVRKKGRKEYKANLLKESPFKQDLELVKR